MLTNWRRSPFSPIDWGSQPPEHPPPPRCSTVSI